MNNLCCKVNPWVICRSCNNYYCTVDWQPYHGSGHIFTHSSNRPVKAYCIMSGKDVKWKNFPGTLEGASELICIEENVNETNV